MTEIKTAQVKGRINEYGSVNLACGNTYGAPSFVAVEGLTESEIHEAAALLEKSLEVCEHERFDPHAIGPTFDYVTECNKLYSSKEPYTFCACGRKVVVK